MKLTTNIYHTVVLWLWINHTAAQSGPFWLHWSGNNHVYYFSNNDKEYWDARDTCVDNGATLVTINNESENQFLYDSYSGTNNYWIGLFCIWFIQSGTDCKNNRRLSWVSGESAGYRDWGNGYNIDNDVINVYTFINFESNNNDKWQFGDNPDNQRRYICEKPDGCQDNPCVNGGTCNIDNSDGYTCACAEGFTGQRCGKHINDCPANACVHGTCEDGINSFTCDCESGYTGASCETDIDECTEPNVCNNGTCSNGPGTFLCICNSGYTGTRCNTNVDECAFRIPICENGATCDNTVGSYMCACVPGYTGQNCSTDINECESDPCLNGGNCTDHINYYECDCPQTYTDVTCSTDVDECVEFGYCGAGTCINIDGGYNCMCQLGFDGINCNEDINECQDGDHPCHNHGNCTNNVGSFNCTCNEGYTSDDQCDEAIHPTPKTQTAEDLTPYRNALTAAAVIASITFVLFMLLLIEDRVYYYRLKKRKTDNDWVNTDEHSQPSTSADTMETSVDACEAGQQNDQFVNIYTENNNDNNVVM